MLQKRTSATFHIVCSDQSRNGKTLFSRLLSDYLILSHRSPLIFDPATSPDGLRSYFPARASKVDLSTTAGQIALFDRALTAPLQDCVLDLPAHLVADVFDLMRHIGFGDAAYTPDVGVVIYFVADGSVDSLAAGRKLRGDYAHGRFIAIKNQAVFTAEVGRLASMLYDSLAKQGQVIVPELNSIARPIIEDRSFSFNRFAENTPQNMPQGTREAVRTFLASVYHQFDILEVSQESATTL